MVRQPKDLEDAKAIYREEKTKLRTSFSAVIGSRWLLAIGATFAIAFASHLMFAPARLPSVGGLSLVQIGLPPVDFGFVGEQAIAARDSAVQEDAPGQLRAIVDEEAAENPILVPALNWLGLALTLIVLAVNLTIMTKRRQFSRG